MIQEIRGLNVPRAYHDGLWKMQAIGKIEGSRNGEVLTSPAPVMLEIQRPWERVLFDPVRDANPFFHAMEFVWMMAGSNDAEWISMFNKRMTEYADDGILRGAYGWRWNNPTNQIKGVIDLLRREPDTRQAVLSMWDATYDGPDAKSSDRPCNTHIYFRTQNDRLNMTVCNRSNDMVWGMLGANAVHMTMLHELIARGAGMKQGIYRVFTNNLHIYTGMPRFKEITDHKVLYDWYSYDDVSTQPLVREGETWTEFVEDCIQLVEGRNLVPFDFQTDWMRRTGINIYHAYLEPENRDILIAIIKAPDWRRACSEWWERRANPNSIGWL